MDYYKFFFGNDSRRSSSSSSQAKFRVKLLNEVGSGSYAKVYQAVRLDDASSSDKRTYYAAKVINLQKAPKDFINKFLPRELDICMKVSIL